MDVAEERAAELDALQAIFDTDFEVVSPSEWRLKLVAGRAALRVSLPDGYPQTAAPIPCLEAEGGNLPAGLAARLAEELVASWAPGEVCIYQWAQQAQEALEQSLGDGASPGGVELTADAAASEPTGPAECSVPISTATAEALSPSLMSAGFSECGLGIYAHGGRGVTVEVGEMLTITVDGIDVEDLGDWVTLQLEEVGRFGAALLEWTAAQRAAEPGFMEEGADEAAESGMDFLPSPEALKVNREREILIYTWGKALRKSPPGDSQFNFNAAVLNGRGGGADLRTMNGLSEEVQRNIASCGLFPRWLEMVTSKIEGASLTACSINCTKGRHRSVAAAEILRSLYYPKATLRHLTIY